MSWKLADVRCIGEPMRDGAESHGEPALHPRHDSISRSVWRLSLILVVGCVGETLTSERHGSVERESARLEYVTIGRGPSLLVVPGGPGFPHTYLSGPLSEMFGDERRLTFYDPRGSGSSSGHDFPAGLTMEAFLEDLDAIRMTIGAESVDLMGHSFGGLLAMHYTLEHPDIVRSLILVDSDPPTYEHWSQFRGVLRARRTEQEAAELASIQSANGWERDPVAVQEYFRVFLRPYFADPNKVERLSFGFDEQSFRKRAVTSEAVRADLGDWNIVPQLQSLRVPALVIAGQESIFPIATQHALHAALPNSHLSVMPGVGHFPFIEDPGTFRTLVTEFLADVNK